MASLPSDKALQFTNANCTTRDNMLAARDGDIHGLSTHLDIESGIKDASCQSNSAMERYEVVTLQAMEEKPLVEVEEELLLKVEEDLLQGEEEVPLPEVEEVPLLDEEEELLQQEEEDERLLAVVVHSIPLPPPIQARPLPQPRGEVQGRGELSERLSLLPPPIPSNPPPIQSPPRNRSYSRNSRSRNRNRNSRNGNSRNRNSRNTPFDKFCLLFMLVMLFMLLAIVILGYDLDDVKYQ